MESIIQKKVMKKNLRSCDVQMKGCGVFRPNGLVHLSQVLVLSECGFGLPGTTLVSLSKTLDHSYFVLWTRHKAVGYVCCVKLIKAPQYTYC